MNCAGQITQSSALPNRNLIYGLASIPLFDCILNQINTAFHVTFGPLSLLQVVRGYMVVVFFAISLWSLVTDRAALRRVPLPAVGALLLLAMASTKEIIVTGALAMPSLGAYGQMAYWVTFWIAVSLVCHERRQAETMLRGLALGALATAASVLIGYLFGGLNPYADDSVAASAGWFDTAKTITGVLVTGCVVILYLYRNKKSWLPAVLAGGCAVACVLTYARAGQVALLFVVLWLSIWYIFLGRRESRRWVGRFLLLIFVAGLLFPLFVNTSSMVDRWSDVENPDTAGSGRATFWRVAADGYLDATAPQQAIGRGYNAMADMLYLNYGADIRHTHNDMLDMLLVGGAVGAFWLLFMIGSFAVNVWRCSLFTPEGAAGLAVLLAYFFHGQFTGQLFGTDSMTYYTLALSCFYAIHAAQSPSTMRLPWRQEIQISSDLSPA